MCACNVNTTNTNTQNCVVNEIFSFAQFNESIKYTHSQQNLSLSLIKCKKINIKYKKNNKNTHKNKYF